MSDEDLRRLAEAANGDRPAGTSGPWPGPQTEEFWNFVAACSPAAILSLLDDRDRLAAEVGRLNDQLLGIAREIGETLPLHVQHRSAVDALRWFAAEVARLRAALADLLEAYIGAMSSEYDFPNRSWLDREGNRDPVVIAARSALEPK